jgi:NADH-quinone oxidoreductase subunit L
MTHAFFKGLLFLAAGSVIHAVGGEQDMRKMGGLRTKIPWTFWTMTAGTFAIAGIPPLAGFFSKDEILWQASRVSLIYWGVGIFTAFLTSFYMFRQWFITFFGEYRGESHGEHGHASHGHDSHGDDHGHGHGGVHESPALMLGPLVVLAILSVVGGWVGIGNRFENFLAPVFHSTATISPDSFDAPTSSAASTPAESLNAAPKSEESEKSTEFLFTGISVGAGVLGFLLAWQLYYRRPELPAEIAGKLGGLYYTVLNKYYVDEVYAAVIVKPLIAFSSAVLWQGIDHGIIDATVDGAAEGAREASDSMRHMQSGNIRSYAGWVAAGAACIIVFMAWMAVGTR